MRVTRKLSILGPTGVGGPETMASPLRVVRDPSSVNARFCPECGSYALRRLGVSINPDGTLRYHLKKGFKVNARGTKVR